MLKKETIIKLAIIFIIFSLGFILRVESTHLYGVSYEEKPFFQDENGISYMYDMDSYYNYRLTENYLNHGYMGDIIINGEQWDLHSYYPPGVPLDYPPLIVYITAYIYKFLNLFANIPLIVVCYWLPAFIAPLCGIPAYLFVRRLTNDFGGIIAGILVVTAPFYFMRTVPGFFDTDMFNLLFPLLIVFFFVEAVYSENRRLKILFATLSGFLMFIFSIAWNGWQYLFYFLVLFCIFYIIWLKYGGKEIKGLWHVFITFLIVTLFLIYIFTGFLNIIKLFLGPFELLSLFGVKDMWAPWPDVYTSVSELQTPSLTSINFGLGTSLFGLGLFGIFYIFVLLKKRNFHQHTSDKLDWFIYLLAVVWVLTAFITLIKGIRFLIMVIPPLTIIAGITAGLGYKFLDIIKTRSLKKFLSLSIIFLIALPSVMVISNSFSILTPRMNDDLWDTAVWIHENTQNGTVVVSSWVYGHFFAAIANRPVTFDGRLGYIETLPVRRFEDGFLTFDGISPNTSREYWISKAFSTSNQSLSLGIFRMLTTSGDTGYQTLDKFTKNTSKSVMILNNILGIDKVTAMEILQKDYHMNQKQAEYVLKYTHPNDPNPFVIVTYDGMINKAYWIFYFGEWDFNKIQGGSYIFSYGDIEISKNILKTDDGLTMDLKTENITLYNRTPYCSIIISGNKIKKRYFNKTSDLCVIINIDDMQSVVIEKRFENSLFTKLAIERTNTTFFKSIYKNNKVVVWKAISK